MKPKRCRRFALPPHSIRESVGIGPVRYRRDLFDKESGRNRVAVGFTRLLRSQGSRNLNPGLEVATALRLKKCRVRALVAKTFDYSGA
jgi:hypothetical protein